jgi:C-terminal processing protease CtpA/Prc
MEACLSALIPAGEYAKSRRRPDLKIEPLGLGAGTKVKRTIRVVVNQGTAREAELFVAALRDRSGATVEGGPMSGLGQRLDRHVLDDGSGYTVPTARFFDLAGTPLFVDRFEDPKPGLAAERKEGAR